MQVNAIARACNYHIWALRHIRRLITVDIAKTLACSIVGDRLDYCNSLLNGTSNKNIAMLQRQQNSLARIVLQMPRSAHTTPLLHSLHWLPVRQRIQYKVAVLVYNAKITSTPPYLHSLLIDHSVHTSGYGQFADTAFRCRRFADAAFRRRGASPHGVSPTRRFVAGV